MQSTQEGDINCPTLPASARVDRIVPALHLQALISVVKLYDAGCEVHLKNIDTLYYTTIN